MSADEWDDLWDWFFEARTRIAALVLAGLTMFLGVCVFVDHAYQTGKDTECNSDQEGMIVNGVLCQDDPEWSSWGMQVRSPEWDVSLLKPWALVALAMFIVPLLNSLIVNGREWASAGFKRWRESATRKAMDERNRRKRAEAASAAATRETARVQQELDALIAKPIEEFA